MNQLLMTQELANKYYLLPILIHHLYTGLNNLTTDTPNGDKKFIRYIIYVVRYHLGAETGTSQIWKLHGAAYV